MSERPIEEVIGWERSAWAFPGESAPRGYNCPFGHCEMGWHTHATVDNLAAWLASRGYAHTMAGALLEGAQGYVRADLHFPPDAIREALVAAVRKVAAS